MTGLELLLGNRAGRGTLRSASGLRRRTPATSDSGKTQEIVLVEVAPAGPERKSPLRLLAMGLGVVGLVGVAYYYLVPDKKTFP